MATAARDSIEDTLVTRGRVRFNLSEFERRIAGNPRVRLSWNYLSKALNESTLVDDPKRARNAQNLRYIIEETATAQGVEFTKDDSFRLHNRQPAAGFAALMADTFGIGQHSALGRQMIAAEAEALSFGQDFIAKQPPMLKTSPSASTEKEDVMTIANEQPVEMPEEDERSRPEDVRFIRATREAEGNPEEMELRRVEHIQSTIARQEHAHRRARVAADNSGDPYALFSDIVTQARGGAPRQR